MNIECLKRVFQTNLEESFLPLRVASHRENCPLSFQRFLGDFGIDVGGCVGTGGFVPDTVLALIGFLIDVAGGVDATDGCC